MYPRLFKTFLLISILSFHNSKTMETYNQLQTYVADNQRDKLVEMHNSKPILFDQISQRKNTLLHIAAWHDSADAAEFLLSHNTPTEERNFHGDNPLHIATRRGNIATARILLKCGTNPLARTLETNLTPLHIAAAHGRNNLVQLLLYFGADHNSRDKKGNTPLHLAIEANRIKCQQTLLECETDLKTRGAKINARDNNGETLLHKAVLKASRAMIFTLLSRGADPTIQNNKGENPIHYALLYSNCSHNSDDVQPDSSILDLFFKATSVTKDQFLNAIRQNQRKKVALYLNYVPLSDTETTFKDLIETTDHAGNNALHIAVLKGQSHATVRMLLEYGVDPYKPNNDNKTPINLAVEIHDKSPNPVNSKIFKILTEEYVED